MRLSKSPSLLLILVFFLAACSPDRAGGVPLSPANSAASGNPENSSGQPTDLPPTPFCKSENLSAEVSASGAGGSMNFTLRLVNAGSTACILEGPPTISLVDNTASPLNISKTYNCMECNTGENESNPSTSESAPPLVGTSAPGDALNRRIGLEPGQGVNVFLTWQNWCEPFPDGGVNIQLALPEDAGILEAPTNVVVGASCDSSGNSSTLIVSEYRQ